MDLSNLKELTSIGEALSAVGMLQNMYSSENTDEMKARGKLIRETIPKLIEANITHDFLYPINDLKVIGKDGVGRRSEIPWVRLHSIELSPRATAGWYVVFLFDTRGEKVFLSLNQGSTKFIDNSFVPRPKDEVEARSYWARKILGNFDFDFSDLCESISLKAQASNLGPSYEASNIYALMYDCSSMPRDQVIYKDVQAFLDLLSVLYSQDANGHYFSEEATSRFQNNYDSADTEFTRRTVSSGQGFYITSEVRALVEEYAMEAAKRHFENKGWVLEDCSSNQPFDYVCSQRSQKIFVEVKGTSSRGESIILTRNEVEHMTQHYPDTALFLLKEIEVVENELGEKQCRGGKAEVLLPWDIRKQKLKVISYQYFL
ncbi:MAG: DUF3578 domain-containing protein [Cyanobacteria bacterium P01_F01_bin.56]